jgi:exopolysaccharide biosynthesis polyprenyl glycosylphosphotransferase
MVIIGSDEEAQRITSHIIDHNAPFWVAGIVAAPGAHRLESTVPKYWIGELTHLPSLVEQFKIDDIVVTDEKIEKLDLIALLDYATSSGITVWFPPKLLPIIEMKFYIDHFCGLPMVQLCSQKNQWLFMKIKHAVDALLALPLFFLLLPVFGIIAVAIKLNSKGPVFYRAQAVGKSGRPFAIYKFRSMAVDTSHDIHRDYVSRLIKGDIKDEENKDQPLKITDDPRVTSVGRFLRKWSLDELPQILNVIKGEMSLVGPRPCLPYEYELYKDWHKKRTSVRPGITGLWQVAGRSAVAFEDMILLDLYYVYNRSLFMDMNTMYETLFAVLKKRGAY